MSGTHARRRTAREIDSERLASLLEQTVLISLAAASFGTGVIGTALQLHV